MDSGTAINIKDGCPYCSTDTIQVYHLGKCPKVKSIEYHGNGLVKKVEFFDSSESA